MLFANEIVNNHSSIEQRFPSFRCFGACRWAQPWTLKPYVQHYRGEILNCWKCNFPMTPYVRPLVGWSVGLSVFHNILKGREDTLPCSYRITCCFVTQSFPQKSLIDQSMKDIKERILIRATILEQNFRRSNLLVHSKGMLKMVGYRKNALQNEMRSELS